MLKKRLASLLLVCVMLISLLPMPARADDEPFPQEGGELLVQTDDESPQPTDDDALPQEDEDPVRQEDEDDAARPETLEPEGEDFSEQTDGPHPQEDVIPLMRMGGLSLMQSGTPSLPSAGDNSAAQEDDPAPIELSNGDYALDPMSDGTYCLRIYMDPVFDVLLEAVEPYCDNISAVYIGAKVKYLDSSDSNSFSAFSHLAAYEVDPDNSNFITNDGVLFKRNSNGTTQLKYYPSAKTDSFTLPDSTVWIDGAAFSNVHRAIINVPVGLELPSDSPISIESLQEISGVEVSILHTSDVESVAIRFQGDTVSSLPVLDAGDTRSLTALVEPAGALPDVAWSSSDEAVATVDSNGTVTAVGKGSADIIATSVGLKGTEHLSASCAVQVRPRVTGVTIASEYGRTALIPDETLTLSASVAPEDANQGLIWSVSDPSVLSLSSDTGSSVTVTALSAGTATIAAVSVRYGTIQDACEITVSVPVTGVTLNTDDFTLYLTSPVSQAKQLAATVHPEDASIQRISWSSSDINVATVSPTGLVSAVSKGTSTITAVSEDNGEAASCVVTVQEVDVSGLTIAPAALTLRIDSSLPTARYGQLSVSLDPVNATYQDVTWTSLAPEIATVDQAGKVTAVGGGDAIIIAASTHGADSALVTAQCKVTVELGAASISIPETLALSLNKEGADSQATLTATIEPSSSTDALTWVSSNESVATVENGKVTAVSEGSATIIVTCGSVKATCAVTVTDYQVKKFDALPQNIRVKVSETGTISAKLGPSHATNKAIVWSIDNGEVASLSEAAVAADGTSTVTVQGLKVGTATVTATSADNDAVVAACTVTVPEIKVESLQLNSSSLKLYRNTPNGKASEFPSTAALTLTVSPADTTNDVVWTSSNSGVVSLGSAQYQTANNIKTGTVTLTAVDGGTSVITATADGQTAQCTVTVVVLATGLTLSASELALVKGTSAALIPTVLPENVDNRTVTWESSDETVATVDANGVVTAVAASGTATITATANDGSGVSAVCTVTVTLTGLTLDRSALTIHRAENSANAGTLVATVTPADTTAGSVTWVSSDPDTVAVESSTAVDKTTGEARVSLSGKKAGTAVITARIGNLIRTCIVTVKQPAGSITLDRTTLSLGLHHNDVAGSGTLRATIDPADSTDALAWSSNNVSVATVDQNGVVTAVSAGTATITAACGSAKATCTVTVEELSVQRVSVTPRRLVMQEGSVSEALLAVIEPSTAANTAVTWRSSNSDVAAVANGIVTAIGVGEAEIIVTTVDGGKSDVCYVTVTPKPVEHITLSKSSIDVFFRETEKRTQTLTATITPGDATDPRVIWTSNNETVATVVGSSDGTATLTLHAAGSAVITATSAGNSTVSAACSVTVRATKVASIHLNKASLELNPLEYDTLTATLTSDSGGYAPDNKAVAWTSSDTSVAVVDTNGKVSAVAAGTAVITVSTDDGAFVATCVVRVWQKVTGVTLDTTSLHLNVGEVGKLNAMVKPSSAANKTVSWESDHPEIAAVDAAGNVTAFSTGSATITATTEDQEEIATCAVTVNSVAVSSVVLNEAALTLLVNDVRTLTATVSPGNATNKAVTWESSDTSVATVVGGVVTAKAAGTATITATADGKSAACDITVYAAVTGVSISGNGILTMNAGAEETLTAAVAPEDGTDSRVTWSSSDINVATVSDNGTVSAVAPGTAVVTITSVANPSKQAFRAVKVVQLATGITLSHAALSLPVGRTAELTAALLGNPTDLSIDWSVSGTAVRVSDNGVVTAEEAGTATVTAAAADGSGVSKSCIVTVYEPVTAVAIQKGGSPVSSLSLTMVTDPAAQLSAVTAGGSGMTVVWSSSSDSVATVDSSGLVSAVGAGTATITVTATTGDVSVSKSCTVTVHKAVISADATAMTLTPASNAANVVFSPWTAGTSLTWNVAGSSVTRTEGALNGSDKTYTISSLNNGVTTISWSKAEDARYEASSGEITVFSVYNPIIAVSIDRSRLEAGSELTASIDQANRTIRVAGYVSETAETYSLGGKLIFAPVSGVIAGLSTEYDTVAGTVVAKLNGSVICTYTLDRGGIVSLPAAVKVKTTLVAEKNTSVSEIDLTNADISGIEAAVSAARTAAGSNIQDGTSVAVTVNLVPVSQTVDKIAGYNTVTLDITPQYAITNQEDGALIDSGTLEELPAAITIQVETAFRPTLIVHKHADSVEYIPFTCIGPNENGLYTVSWQQSTFSEVAFLDEAAAQQYLAEQAKANEPPAADKPTKPAAGGEITPVGGAGAPAGSAPAAVGAAQAAAAEHAFRTFADVSTSHWAADAIAYASVHGIMVGMGNGRFAPETTASRAMIAQILFNLTPDRAAGTQGFADAAGTWYDEAACWAASCGIVDGINGRFCGSDALTREQLVTMLYRYAQFMGRDVSTGAADYDRFTDAARVSPWASDAMRWAVGSGLIQGIGDTLLPGAGSTRAQIAMIMMRFCESAVV